MDIRKRTVACVALVGTLAYMCAMPTYCAAQGTESVRITEVMYNPSANGVEFIELQNISSTTLDLTGIHFTDGIEFAFSPGATLAPGVYAVLSASETEFTAMYPSIPLAGVYTGVLSGGGETIALSNAGGDPFLSFTYDDDEPWPKAADGFGFSLVLMDTGLDANDPSAWGASAVPGGSPGEPDAGTPDTIPHVLVNEVLTHTDAPMADAIELYNPTAVEADIRGWFLTDDGDEPQKARVPDEAQYVLSPGSYAILYESDFVENPGSVGGADLPGFSLSSHGEEVYLFAADEMENVLGYCHGYAFGAAQNGVSFGRYVSSDGGDHFVTQVYLTLGSANAGPFVGPVVISEIYYNPVALETEYLELTNISDTPIPLWDTSVGGNPNNTWKVDGIGFAFVGNHTIPAGGKALIVNADPTQFQSQHGVPGDVLVQGPFGNDSVDQTAALNNAGETLTVLWPDTPDLDVIPYVAVDEVTYDDEPAWPSADGNGKAIRRIDLTQYGNDPANWVALDPSYDNSGPGSGASDVNGDTVTDAVDVQLVINAALGLGSVYDCDVNGDSAVNALDVQLVINGALGFR